MRADAVAFPAHVSPDLVGGLNLPSQTDGRGSRSPGVRRHLADVPAHQLHVIEVFGRQEPEPAGWPREGLVAHVRVRAWLPNPVGPVAQRWSTTLAAVPACNFSKTIG